jgi:hypothetical protein
MPLADDTLSSLNEKRETLFFSWRYKTAMQKITWKVKLLIGLRM